MRRSLLALGLVAAIGVLGIAAALTTSRSHAAPPPAGIHKIKHVIVIMQENRSFDQYFGTYPGADGIPTQRRRGVRLVRAEPGERRVREAVPRHARPERRRPSRPGRLDRRHRRREDGRLRPAARRTPRSRAASRTRPTRSARSAAMNPDVMGYHDGERHPELLGVRAELRPPGPHVRAERVVEPPGPPLHGLGVVGEVHEARRSLQLRQRAPEPGAAAGPEAATRPASRRSTPGPT